MPGEKVRKIVILGSRYVGKSALTLRFCTGNFPQKHLPTVINTHTKRIKLNGQKYKLNIVDTAGMDKYDRFLEQYSVGVDGYILAFSIADLDSFNNLLVINEKIASATFGCKIPLVLVGNKSDLPDEDRVVSKEKAEEFAEELKCEFFEASAKTNLNIELIFQTLLEKMPTPDKKSKTFCCLF